MHKFAMVSLVALGGCGTVVPMATAKTEETIRSNVFVEGNALGGLTPEAAQLKLRQWWEQSRRKKLVLQAKGSKAKLPSLTPTMLGVGLDDVATVNQLPLAAITPDEMQPERVDFAPVYKKIGDPDASLATLIQKASTSKEARAVWRKGAVVRSPEGVSQTLDTSTVADRTIEILTAKKNTVPLDLKQAAKHVTDEDLKKITHVVSTFSTRFSAGNRPRSANIKLAASFFDGQVLMPGDRISYNDTVGQRTIKRGFKVAGVYIDGRHDTGVGGGICQVSTTLYNAALFADMKIVKRRNHSLPVPYVPLGRDATVDWGNIDLVLENSSDSPIAVESSYTPGQLTFRVLGAEPNPEKKIVVEGSGVRYSAGRTVTKRDPSLPAGTRRVAEGGGTAKSVSTVRIVKENGKVVRRDSLGTSYYTGSPRVILVGTAKPKPKPVVVPPTTAPVVVPPATVPSPPPATAPAQTAPPQ